MPKTGMIALIVAAICGSLFCFLKYYQYSKIDHSTESRLMTEISPEKSRQQERLSGMGGAFGLLRGSTSSSVQRSQLLSEIAARCASYIVSDSVHRSEVTMSPKLSSWCKGMENVISPIEVEAIRNESAQQPRSEVLRKANSFFNAHASEESFRDEVGVLKMAANPQEIAAMAQVMDRTNPAELWERAGVARSRASRPEVLSRFAGLMVWCQKYYCDADSLATIEVCEWPGNDCGAEFDFNRALASNFSQNDIDRMGKLAARISYLRGAP